MRSIARDPALLLLLLASLGAAEPQSTPARGGSAATEWRPGVPETLHEVVEVVDGDTIHVLRDGEVERLRLLSVDTEEKLLGRSSDWTKPETVFGEETARWARELFAELATGGEPARVGLLFPDGREERDAYGRLLCHVILPDGRDLNLLLVELGKSPYFNKYGDSRPCHDAFVAAQAAARAAERGIWDPDTNAATTEGRPTVKRPYDLLLPWWEARARALEDFRERSAEAPGRVVSAEDPEAMARAAERGGEVEVFGTVWRAFDEDDGSRTLVFRSPHPDRAFRARVPAAARAGLRPLRLESLGEAFRQNYVYVRGALGPSARGGFEMDAGERDRWRLAGPEPDLPREPTPPPR